MPSPAVRDSITIAGSLHKNFLWSLHMPKPILVGLGSVTHQLLRSSRCPVLIVPRGLEAALDDLAALQEAATR
jgi:hypothetical protein